MMENLMEISFSSISQNEAFARSVAAAFVTQMNPTIAEMTDIRTAVSEAVTNAIVHGYRNDPTKTVVMKCTISGETVTVTVTDNGVGISDISLAMQPFYTTMPDTERSGMGFAVMEAFMDEVNVESAPDKGTTVTMKKRISAVRSDE